MAKSTKRVSPKACPKCGTLAITKTMVADKQGFERPRYQCNREGCGHTASSFPTVSALATRPGQMNPHGSGKGMASGCTMVRPTGNRFS